MALQSPPRSRAARLADAIAALSGVLAFLRVLPNPARSVTTLVDLLRRYPVRGGDIFDLQIIATMKVNNVERMYTFNAADFEVFPN